MSSNRVSLCGALLVAACSRPSTPTRDATPAANSVVIPVAEAAPAETSTTAPPATGSAAAPGDDCERLFAAPANADKLCDEHDNAVDSELHWQSWATTESRVDVNRRYHEWASRCHFGFVTKPPIFSVTKGPTRLSTHEASPVSYPTCEKKPSPAHKTVIVISMMLKH